MLCVADNVDTSQIEYDSTSGAPWSFVQDPLGNSLSKIDGLGSAVFRFTGSLVTVYGAVMPTGSDNGTLIRSQYTLDQQAPNIFAQPTNFVWSEQNGSLFYTSGDISYGNHVLVINVTQASTFAPYYLDYITYTCDSIPSSSSSSTSNTGSTTTTTDTGSTTTTADTGSTTTTTDTGLPTISPTSVVEKSNNDNVIVGGVIGGAIGLIAIILAIFFFCFGRRALQRYTARKKDIHSELPTEATDVTPYIAFDLVSSPHMSEARSPTPLQIANRASGGRHSFPHEATPSSFTLSLDDAASQAVGALMISPSASRKSGMPPPVASEPPAMHHGDSGLRFRSEATPSEVAPIDVPPVYTPN